MFRIAICDDDLEIIKQIKALLIECEIELDQEFDIMTFSRGEDLANYLRLNDPFDLIFLDIELGGLNGVDVGKMIRYELDDQMTFIIYISWNQSYAMELFEIRPVNFIIKPIGKKVIRNEVEKVLRLADKGEKLFTYRMGRKKYKKHLRDILYFESMDRKIKIWCKNETHIFYGKLEDVYNELRHYGFFYTHKSYIANYAHIIQFEYEQIILSSGKVLPISQSRRKEVREMQMQYEKEGNIR